MIWRIVLTVLFTILLVLNGELLGFWQGEFITSICFTKVLKNPEITKLLEQQIQINVLFSWKYRKKFLYLQAITKNRMI